MSKYVLEVYGAYGDIGPCYCLCTKSEGHGKGMKHYCLHADREWEDCIGLGCDGCPAQKVKEKP